MERPCSSAPASWCRRGRLVRLRRLRLPERPALGRNAWLWTIICVIFGPLGLMVLFVFPRREHDAGSVHPTQAHKSEQEALYEVPKKKH